MKYLKIVSGIFFVLLVSFFVVKSCVHPKRSPSSHEAESGTPFFSKLIPFQRHIVIAPRPEAEKRPVVPKTAPHVAIILDDWGKNYTVLKNAIEIHRPLTLAVIPYLS